MIRRSPRSATFEAAVPDDARASVSANAASSTSALRIGKNLLVSTSPPAYFVKGRFWDVLAPRTPPCCFLALGLTFSSSSSWCSGHSLASSSSSSWRWSAFAPRWSGSAWPPGWERLVLAQLMTSAGAVGAGAAGAGAGVGAGVGATARRALDAERCRLEVERSRREQHGLAQHEVRLRVRAAGQVDRQRVAGLARFEISSRGGVENGRATGEMLDRDQADRAAVADDVERRGGNSPVRRCPLVVRAQACRSVAADSGRRCATNQAQCSNAEQNEQSGSVRRRSRGGGGAPAASRA